MPYFRKRKGTFRRRRRGGFKNYSKSKKLVTGHGPTMLEKIANGVGTAAKVASAVLPAISAINTELKYFDISQSLPAYNPGTNDQIVNITQGIAQGTTDQTRIGNSLLAKDLYLKAFIYWTATSAVPFGVSRLTLICWKDNVQNNAPTIGKVFQSTTDINSAINKDYSDQFVVLKDKMFTHNMSVALTGTQQAVHVFKWYKKLNWHLRYAGATTTSGTVNHIYLIFRGGAPTSANQSGINVYSRLNFTDN